ncbi:DNA-directed RNA polymerase subunit A' [Candidatus Pacearchaeota archaeon]|nr:DNA-directed RNA polymerase subunit A' [Candidatus Pacearchaeota archaeon]
MAEYIRKHIKALKFSLLSPEKIKKISAAKIITPELYDAEGYPVDGGVMDLRLGAIDPGVRCRTCGGGLKECLGHPGSIDLARPVIHIKYIPIAELFLKAFCFECARLPLVDEDVKKYGLIQRIKKAKDVKKCPHCNTPREKIKVEKPTNFSYGKKRIFPTEIRDFFVKISDDDCRKVGVNPSTCRPEWTILTLLLVPPVTVRPSITLETGERSEDDTTHKLTDIVRVNQRLWENLNAGAPEVIIEDLWDLLQYHITTFFDNSVPNIPPARHRSGQPLKTITERIKGKEGRIRHNLAGKRVNYSSRTVISPDPFIKINEVGVPYEIAKIITVAEKVTSANIKQMRELIKSDGYPGANYVIRPDGKRKKITPDLKEEIIEEIEPGYIVERHLVDKDIVLFNRHPSLHKLSIMSHHARILPDKTFRLHPAVTFPYNADFDGDEMNIHSPQTEEARSEAINLLNVNKNLFSVKNNTPVIGCISDAITGNYLLSLSKIDKSAASQLMFKAGVVSNFVKKIVDGIEIHKSILPKELRDKIKSSVSSSHFGVEDGELTKELDKLMGTEMTLDIIDKIFRIGTSYLSQEGFSISVKNIDVNEKIKQYTSSIIKKAEEEASSIIQSYIEKTLEPIPGKSMKETMEIKVLKVLNETRSIVGEVVKNEFPKENPVNTMILSGVGGNILHITQMACFVGQQSLWGGRINFGYKNRTLSFFKKGDLSPRARGFIYSSYLKGLNPKEFFFGAITGRDSLMDTALRTPKSGYLYRRLANALQDIKVEYDGTVRDASGNIMQFVYGDDGNDISTLHKGGKVSPGEAVGILTAQSFGEPSTQMALNVFHFSGVQEMQVTTGLPRMIEIFDARKTPSTPSMEIYLDREYNNEKNARILAEKIREVKLKDIISEMKVNFSDKRLEIFLDMRTVKTIHTSMDKIIEKLVEKNFKAKFTGNKIIISYPEANFKDLYKLKEKLKSTIISGVKGIKEILVVRKEGNFIILTYGSNLKDILNLKGIDKNKTISNDIHEIADVLGIESARQAIINEINRVIENQGFDIDERHLKLIADAMCSSGNVKGVTRMGIIAQKSSILARASFETPINQFVNATINASKDELSSVIENIIINQPVPVGTGFPGLLVKVIGPLTKKK